MPPPPEVDEPGSGGKVTHYGAAATTGLKWKETPGVSKYVVQIFSEGKPVRKEVVTSPKASFKNLVPGKYKWSVTPVVEAPSGGRAPASLASRQWEGKPSEPAEFVIQRKELAAPVPVEPLGSVEPSKDGILKFKWRSVDGAEAYRVEVTPKTTGRALATDPKPFQLVVKNDNVAKIRLSKNGVYNWRVRALANVDPATQLPDSVGPESSAEFKLDPNVGYYEGSGYVAVSTMLAPYTYRTTSTDSTHRGSASSSALTFRLSGEYYFHPKLGVGVGGETTQFKISGKDYSRKGFESFLKYRMKWGEGNRSWSFSPKVGVEARDYFQIFNPALNLSNVGVTALGGAIGFDLRKQLGDKFSIGAKVAYFIPLILSSDSDVQKVSEGSYRNFSAGLQGLYWLTKHWGAGAGGFYDLRSIGYRLNSTGSTDQVYMDGTYFFGSILYSFGGR
jgi:hypothetical protein